MHSGFRFEAITYCFSGFKEKHINQPLKYSATVTKKYYTNVYSNHFWIHAGRYKLLYDIYCNKNSSTHMQFDLYCQSKARVHNMKLKMLHAEAFQYVSNIGQG